MSGLLYAGKISIGGMCPIVLSGVAEATLSLEASLAGASSLVVSLGLTPPSLAGNLAMAIQMVAQLTIALTLGLPGVDFQITACLAFIAQIEAELAILLELTGLLATAGIFAYGYSGPANQLGPALTAELATQWRDGTPASANATAVILGAVDGAAVVGMTTFFAGVGI